MSLATCKLDVNVTLPLLCICSLFSFLCGVGIGANDLSANFAMVVGSGSLDMKSAIVYCAVFELLGAAFMGGKVSSTIRNGIVRPELFSQNRHVVVIGMTCASFAAALWLYLSTVFGLPVSITHTVIGSILGFAIFATYNFRDVEARGLTVVVVSWVVAPLAACAVTAALFYYMRRGIFHVKGRSFALAYQALPYCLAASLLVDLMFVAIEQPPVMTRTMARWVPVWVQFGLLLLMVASFCALSVRWIFPRVSAAAWEARSFVWESAALYTEVVPLSPTAQDYRSTELRHEMSFFHNGHHHDTSHLRSAYKAIDSAAPHEQPHNRLTGKDDANNSWNDDAETRRALTRSPHEVREGRRRNAAATPNPALGLNASMIMAPVATASGGHVLRRNKVRLTPVPNAPAGKRGPEGASSAARVQDKAEVGSARKTITAVDDVPQARQHSLAGEEEEMTAKPSIQPESQSEEAALTPNSAAALLRTTQPIAGTGQYHSCASATHVAAPPSASAHAALHTASFVAPASPTTVGSEDEFGEEDWAMDHPMLPINFQGLYIKPFNPRAEYLFTGLQVVAGSMSSFVHGAVAGANATAAFVILYDAFTNHELGESDLSTTWSVVPAMLGIAIGMCALGASLMKTVGMELVTVTPARGWCIQMGGTFVTMILTGIGIPVSLSQSQVGAAIGCGVLDAKMRGVSWGLVCKIIAGWVVTLVISAVTTGLSMCLLGWFLC